MSEVTPRVFSTGIDTEQMGRAHLLARSSGLGGSISQLYEQAVEGMERTTLQNLGFVPTHGGFYIARFKYIQNGNMFMAHGSTPSGEYKHSSFYKMSEGEGDYWNNQAQVRCLTEEQLEALKPLPDETAHPLYLELAELSYLGRYNKMRSYLKAFNGEASLLEKDMLSIFLQLNSAAIRVLQRTNTELRMALEKSLGLSYK